MNYFQGILLRKVSFKCSADMHALLAASDKTSKGEERRKRRNFSISRMRERNIICESLSTKIPSSQLLSHVDIKVDSFRCIVFQSSC